MSLPTGKVAPKILKRTVFTYLGSKRNDVVVAPAEGEDASIIRIGDELLAIHCDPISGAYGNIGWIAINIATNDIATRGVRPRWVLSCIMLSQGSDETVLSKICKQMDDAAKRLGVSIVGGHTEVTIGLDHPLVMVSALGVVQNGRYITTRGAKPGNKIILTKSIGIEGTAILAFDQEELLSNFFRRNFLERAKSYFNKLSVLQEALSAFSYGGVLAMHDPTEGGLAGGLNEMANASKTGFRVYEEKIPISHETSELCSFFKLDPLRLISSGSLLIVASNDKADGVVRRLEEGGINASLIGEVLADSKCRKIIRRNGCEEALTMPESDELWKALSKR